MSRKTSSLFSAALVGPALLGSVRKLDPRAMIRNPVMFVVEVVAALTTVLFVLDLVTGGADRIVKQFFSARSGRAAQASRHLPSLEAPAPRSFAAVTKGPVLPGEAETAANPRARSAKLRAVERTDAPVPAPLAAIETLAALPARIGRSGGARR